MVGRIVRSADFERVLATAPRSRSAHFAAHHVAAGPSAPGRGGSQHADNNLSTAAHRTCPPVVDERPDDCWLGTVVPKRHARRAVTRNLLKRQMRQAMAAHAERLPPGLWVLRLRSPFERSRFVSAASAALRAAARDELDQLLQQAASGPAPRRARAGQPT
jgi:ribonuclease P protein component